MYRLVLISISFIILNNSSYSQAPKYSNEFMSIGVGARALGMGNANVASVNDVTAAYWNPAQLLSVPNDLQLGAMHSEYFAGIAKFDYLGASMRQGDSSVIGFSLIRFGVDDIPNTLELIDKDGNIRYDRIKSFSVADYAFMFSYARKSKIEGFNYGANAKIIRRIAGEFASSWGFGIDAAASYLYKDFRFGVLARDITTTFNAWSFQTDELEEVFIMTGNEIPENSIEITLPKIITGIAYNFNLNESFEALAELNFDISSDGKRNVLLKGDPFSIDPHLGMEFSYNKMFYVRLGVSNIQKARDFDDKENYSFQPSMGLGIRYKQLGIDYAFTDIGDKSIALYSNVFTLFYAFNRVN